MTDQELLELAAKAAGVQYEMDKDGIMWTRGPWFPLTDDGDALRLAVKLGIVVDCSRPSAGLPWTKHAILRDETISKEELTRRAIVRAAAEVGRAMK